MLSHFVVLEYHMEDNHNLDMDGEILSDFFEGFLLVVFNNYEHEPSGTH